MNSDPVVVYIKILDPRAKVPQRMTAGAAGADLYACLDSELVLQPLERALIPCGFSMELPPGYEAQVRPRSGLALKQGLSVLNTPGTVDEDYRGPIGVVLVNLSPVPTTVKPGDRIAQMVITRYSQALYSLSQELSDSERGQGGFGSTGV